jgi:hypothetical protein
MFTFSLYKWRNLVVEWLTLLLRIRELPGSNLGPETSIPDWGVSWLSSVPPGEYRKYLNIRPRPPASKPLQVIIHLSPFHSMLVSFSFGSREISLLTFSKSKVTPSRTHHAGAKGKRRYISYSVLNSARDGGQWSASWPGRALSPRKDPRHPLDRMLGLRAGLDTKATGKIRLLCRDRTPVVQSKSDTILTELLWLLLTFRKKFKHNKTLSGRKICYWDRDFCNIVSHSGKTTHLASDHKNFRPH